MCILGLVLAKERYLTTLLAFFAKSLHIDEKRSSVELPKSREYFYEGVVIGALLFRLVKCEYSQFRASEYASDQTAGCAN